MPRFFVDKIDGETVTVTGADAKHIALSLRMKTGEQVTLCGGGMDAQCELTRITPEEVVCRVIETSSSSSEPDVRLRLFQAVPKGEKAEIIVQKAVELGVSEITFMLTERCISRPDDKSFAKKLNRYNRIALEAAKQSGRSAVPAVNGMVSLSQAAELAAEHDSVVWCYEKGGCSFSSLELKGGSSIALLIGSEGGFSDSEAELLRGRGFKPVSMGSRILRCETAPLAAAAIIMNLTGNM